MRNYLMSLVVTLALFSSALPISYAGRYGSELAGVESSLNPVVQQSVPHCSDPVPNPAQAGWTQEGDQPEQGQGSPLIVNDPSTQPGSFINFFCPGDDPLFTTEIVLTPRLSIDTGFGADAGNIGVHVTINDGVREVRAMIFDAGGGRSRVALIKNDNSPTTGFIFNNLSPDFTLKRRTDGTGVLSVPSSGMADEEIPLTVQAFSSRPGQKTLEFGSHKDYGTSSTSRWETLGLPRPQCFDPVPNPAAAGWTVEENGGADVQEGTPLGMIDPSSSPGVFANVRVSDDAIFQQEIVLTPHLTLDATSGKDPADGSLGVHVTINDGVKMIRAVLLEAAPNVLKVALVAPAVPNGYTSGFIFTGLTANFTLKRLADGTGVLQVPNPVSGQPPLSEELPASQQPDSDRAGTKTLEFGVLNTPARSNSFWDSLGLPCNPSEFPLGLTVRQVRVNDDNNDKVRFLGNFSLGQGQTIDPTTETVMLKFSANNTEYYSAGGPAGLPPGSFERKRNSSPARWGLTDAARNTFGLECFDILERDGSIHFVDRRTEVTSGDFSNTTIEFAVGDDRGSVNVVLEQRPPGSGRWRLDR